MIDVTQYSHKAIDAEWFWKIVKGGKKAEYITVQCGFSNNDGIVKLIVVFWDYRFSTPSDEQVKQLEVDLNIEIKIIITDKLDKENLLQYFVLPPQLQTLMYYSPKDMQGLLGAERWREMLLETVAGKKTVNKMRRLNVADFKFNECKLETTDLIGMFTMSLDSALNSVGIDNPYKSLATKGSRDKSRMELFVKEDPFEFLKYAVGDVLYLHKAMILRTEQINEIVEKALGLKNLYTINDVKLSSGSLVADIFEKWLISTQPELFKSVMMLSNSNNNKEWGELSSLRKSLQNSSDIETVIKVNNKIKYMPATVHGLAAGSIRAYYPGNYGTGTVTYGAVVQGGRCINERPETNYIENILDIDLSSCYGSAIRKFDYPFGLPTVYGKDIDDENLTLGDFLNKYGDELINGLYQIYVSGELNFHQDLVHSKYNLSTRKIASQLFAGEKGEFEQESEFTWDREIETAHIDGDFTLTTKQIELGIITGENLEVIRKVSSAIELQGWMNLTVDCAIYYPISKEVRIDSFIETVMNDKTRGAKRCKSDTRTNIWCRMSLEHFVGNFINARKEFKAEMKKQINNIEERNRLDLLQNSCKLFINCVYGCLAAPFFPMGNTILANNITTKARTGVWLLAKALNTVQSITDGGIYSPTQVHKLKLNNKKFSKPGFNTLYLRKGETWCRNVETLELYPVSIIKDIRDILDSKDIDRINEIQNYIDTNSTKHINDFWNVYGLKLSFDIEHKMANTGYHASYTGSADYAINTGKDIIIKTRGAKPEDHPKKQYLKALLNKTPINELKHTYMDSKSMGVSQFQEQPDELFLPGDDIDVPTALKPRKDAGILYTTHKDLKSAKDRHDKAIRRYQKENEGRLLENWTRFPTIK